MKNRKMVSLLLAVVMTAVLLAVPAQAAEAPSAVRVGSYKGTTLTVGEISGLMIYPSTANDSVVSSDPDIVRVGNVLGRWTATAQNPGTATITVTTPDGRTGSVTITVESAESVVSGEAEDPAAYSEVRQELVRLIVLVSKFHWFMHSGSRYHPPKLYPSRVGSSGIYSILLP